MRGAMRASRLEMAGVCLISISDTRFPSQGGKRLRMRSVGRAATMDHLIHQVMVRGGPRS